MFTKLNVKSQKVNVTEVPLQLFYNIGCDIYKHTHIREGKSVFTSLA